MTEDFVFHYQKRDGHKLVHDVSVTFSEEETHGKTSVLSKFADFLKAVGHDFDYIEAVKRPKGIFSEGKK